MRYQECGYCWAVFHRLRVDSDASVGPFMDYPCPLPPPTAPEMEEALEYVDAARFYDRYYVTLRRPQATHRSG